jgi:heptosyltransferase-2
MDYNQVKFDCLHFKGEYPCVPNKERGKICFNCDEYAPAGKKILIIKLGALGDVIRTTPLAVYFKKAHSNCHITWITKSPEILPKKEINDIYNFQFPEISIILNKSFDIAINLDKDKEACILLKQVDAVKKYGFSWENGHIFPLNKAAEDKMITGLFDEYSQKNEKSYQQEIFGICDLQFHKEKFLLDVNQKFYNKWSILKEKADGKPIIGLNTGCGKRWMTRLWPEDYWVELIKKLQVNNLYPVLLGGKDEDLMNIRYSEITGAYYPGTFSLEEFISLTANCGIIVTAVSMMMHIAIALDKPLVLFNNIFNKHEKVPG